MTLLGIDIGGTSIKFGLIISGNIIHSTEISSKVEDTLQFTELLSLKIKELSNENNIEYIDPREEFRKITTDLYYSRDNHFNPAGHKAIGNIISKKLIEHFDPSTASLSAKVIN